ncbi:MAG: class I SAM-dependent methyltransferase, partial [Pseudomonadota bacterium]
CITKYLPLRGALAVHAVMLAAAFIVLPLALPSGWEAAPESGQAFWLIGLFAVAVGLPFFAVSANSPLLQAWFARTGHAQAHDPYFLYGASNIGSFASLWLYAGLFEPTLAVPTQTLAWMLGYGALALLILACGLLAVGRSTATVEQVAEKAAPVDAITRVKWIGLAAIPSGLLVAVTAHVSTDIASAPFLWIVPLSLFLLSFVVAFARKPLIEGQMLSLLTFGFGVAAFFASRSGGGGLQWPLLAATMVFFFLAATLCHSKLAALKPAARHLTSFYLWMSFGGVVGGVVTTFGAPALFNTVAEFPLLIVAVLLLRGHHTSPFVRRIEQGALVLLMVWIAGAATIGFGSNELIAKRSFYGTVRVNMMEDQRYVAMQHGTTLHGAMRAEDLAEGTTPKPLTYYHETGGIAQALFARQQIVGDRLAHMGVIGLGTGSLLCHRKPNELWTNYEIDRDVVELASDPRYFRFVSACGQGDPIEVADGRLGVARHNGANFDYLLVDAFSSNSVPPHLLTREAMAVYMDKMAEDGIVVMHISNRFMELRSVVAALAQDAGLAMRVGIFPR